ncbi:MAG: hypothetical protein QFB87_05175 [Patescibacteria group bacterium]|nr:hypothetical protein [Patescibacteria group bacterium]
MAGQVTVNAVQLGDSATAANNFVVSVPTPPNGTIKISKGNVGATTQDVLAIDASGNAAFIGKVTQAMQSMVRLQGANGFGSTNTAQRRYSNVVTNQGSDITYADSATLGATFTINTSGVYGMSCTDATTAAADFGISKNATVLTTVPSTLSEVLSEGTTPAAAYRASCGATVYLLAGDVIRVYATGTPSGTRQFFSITKVD